MGALRQAAKTELSLTHSTRGHAPGEATSRRPAPRKACAFLGFALVAVSIGSLSSRVHRERARASERRDAEVKDLDERFSLEKERLESKLQDLRIRAEQGLPSTAVTSFSVWEKRVQSDGRTGYLRIGGASPASAWEQALDRILPATIESRFGPARAASPLVLPLDGPSGAVDSPLRLALFRENGAVGAGGESAEKVIALAFHSAALIEKSAGAGGIKRFLIDPTGLVLAHVSPEEVGTRIAALGDLFRKSESTGRIESRSWEGFPSTIRFETIPGWNAVFVMERTHAPVKAGGTLSISDFFLFGAILAFGLLLIFLGIPTSKSPKTETAAPKPRTPAGRLGPQAQPKMADAPLVPRAQPRTAAAPLASRAQPPTVPIRTQLESELGRFVSARVARQEGREASRVTHDRILLESFDVEARGASTERLERTLADAAARAVGSPVLYFRYNAHQGVAELTTASGYSAEAIRSGGMSFSLPRALVTDIRAGEVAGRKLGLHDHAPLARLMRSRFGIATFEAWPMASSRPASQGTDGLHGVLVITRSGAASVLQRGLVGALLDHAAARHC